MIFFVNTMPSNQAQVPARLAAARQVGGSVPAIGVLNAPIATTEGCVGFGVFNTYPNSLKNGKIKI